MPDDHDACPPYELPGFENNDDDENWADVNAVPDPTPANLTGVFVTPPPPPLVLLPLFLLLLTPNDVLRNSTTGSRNNHSYPVIFAEDTQILLSDSPFEYNDLIRRVCRDANALRRWSDINGLTLNAKKTKRAGAPGALTFAVIVYIVAIVVAFVSKKCLNLKMYESEKSKYSSLTVEKLRQLLERRGAKQGGRKKELIERKSAALACRRFQGTHSFDRVSEILFNINDDYDLLANDKIIGTVTNNCSNFVKAFNTFGQEHDDSDVTTSLPLRKAERAIFGPLCMKNSIQAYAAKKESPIELVFISLGVASATNYTANNSQSQKTNSITQNYKIKLVQ
ncbi:unnamed protein product [Trichogramma brassicae]|uniref:SAP domain-containing protein n=1 Tax=Trichogramma brassicae TaxID=86971 RepID=A0A6H5IIA1_9HYME|nr:unnamed protein product [Trichogramma brassicae]